MRSNCNSLLTQKGFPSLCLLGLFICFIMSSVFFTSCTEDTSITKRDRLSLFVISLNTSVRSGIEENFIEGSSANRAAFSTSLLPEGESYTWNESGSLSDKITGEFRKVSDNSYACTAEFYFENSQKNIFESEQWEIEKMEIWNAVAEIPNHFIYR